MLLLRKQLLFLHDLQGKASVLERRQVSLGIDRDKLRHHLQLKAQVPLVMNSGKSSSILVY